MLVSTTEFVRNYIERQVLISEQLDLFFRLQRRFVGVERQYTVRDIITNYSWPGLDKLESEIHSYVHNMVVTKKAEWIYQWPSPMQNFLCTLGMMQPIPPLNTPFRLL